MSATARSTAGLANTCFLLKSAALSPSPIWVSCVSGRTSCTSWATKAWPLPDNSTKTKFNKAQRHRPSVRSFEELWLAQHTVPAHPKRMIFGSSTLRLNKTFTLIPVIQSEWRNRNKWYNFTFVTYYYLFTYMYNYIYIYIQYYVMCVCIPPASQLFCPRHSWSRAPNPIGSCKLSCDELWLVWSKMLDGKDIPHTTTGEARLEGGVAWHVYTTNQHNSPQINHTSFLWMPQAACTFRRQSAPTRNKSIHVYLPRTLPRYMHVRPPGSKAPMLMEKPFSATGVTLAKNPQEINEHRTSNLRACHHIV